MTDLIPIRRELLERIDESAICDGTDATISDDLFTQLVAALDAPRQPAGWKLVPERMHLDSSVIETIQAHCGDGQEDVGYGPYSDGVLWIGECEEEDGSKTYGLHIATADYPEEGSSTLIEFAAAPSAPDTAQGDAQRPFYTCIGKGGEYRYLGTAIGAGDSRGELVEVYQDENGQLYHRTPEDFMERMEPIAAARKG